MSLALEELILWAQKKLAPEALEAQRQAQSTKDYQMRELAFAVVEREESYDFSEFFPLYPEESTSALELAFCVLRTTYLTAAVSRNFQGVEQDISDRLLVVMGVIFDPWRFGGQLVSSGEAKDFGDVLETLGGCELVCDSIMRLIKERIKHLGDVCYPNAKALLFRHIGISASIETALVIFDDDTMRPEELALIETIRASRRWGFTRFLSKACLCDDGNNMEKASAMMNCLQEAVGICLEEEGEEATLEPTARDLIRLFPVMQERAGILACLAMVVAAGGSISPQGEQFIRLMGEAIEIPDNDISIIIYRASLGKK